uniref:Uncharacterized protein n=1 Tax=Leishmania guyanensis TaxID=5670 RepID=A0A1E1IPS6_LEIGU|nr:Hypothetical protein BN36_0807320 [Leishmania guyanensis]
MLTYLHTVQHHCHPCHRLLQVRALTHVTCAHNALPTSLFSVHHTLTSGAKNVCNVTHAHARVRTSLLANRVSGAHRSLSLSLSTPFPISARPRTHSPFAWEPQTKRLPIK